MNLTWAIGIDVGGTKTAAALVNLIDGSTRDRRHVATLPQRCGSAVFEDVLRLAEELKGRARDDGLEVAAVGVGVCELVSTDGRILSANLFNWRDVPVAQRLSSIARATVEADVRAAALAEAMFGAGRSLKCFLYVTIGTGISCCLVIDGKPYAGARGASGTMASSPSSLVCPACGNLDGRTLEEIASGSGLVACYRRASGGTAERAEEVFEAARTGDAVAAQVIASAADALGTAIGLLVNVVDPQAVILGGGLGLSEVAFQRRVEEATRAHIWWDGHRNVPIFPGALGVDAGVIGAAAAAAAAGSFPPKEKP